MVSGKWTRKVWVPNKESIPRMTYIQVIKARHSFNFLIFLEFCFMWGLRRNKMTLYLNLRLLKQSSLPHIIYSDCKINVVSTYALNHATLRIEDCLLVKAPNFLFLQKIYALRQKKFLTFTWAYKYNKDTYFTNQHPCDKQ